MARTQTHNLVFASNVKKTLINIIYRLCLESHRYVITILIIHLIALFSSLAINEYVEG
jgi:hypothetical protein